MSNKLCTIYLLVVLSTSASLTNADNIATDNIATNFIMINDYNLPEYATIWDRMRSGFRLSHKETDRVKYYEKFYTKNPEAFTRLINNAKPYLYYILTQTEKNGMPSEVALIPAIESTFNPQAQNPTDSYAGMWQFIPSTGRQFNLQQNDDFDDRQNVIKSTKAAMQHLNYLYTMFKQWDVAIGAYNWGEGNMYRAILNSNQTIGKINYSTLPLRQITANYVPKIIALSNIIENPRKFGVQLEKISNEPYFAITTLTTTSSINELHKVANIDKSNFINLNPQFKNDHYKLPTNEQIALPLKNQMFYYANINNNGNSNVNVNSNIDSTIHTLPTDNTIPVATTNTNSTPSDELMDTVYQIDETDSNKTPLIMEKNTSNTIKSNTIKVNTNNQIKVSNDNAQDDNNQSNNTNSTSLDNLINTLDKD